MRRLIGVLFATFLGLLALAGCAPGDSSLEVPTPQAGVYVYDQDDILDQTTEDQLNPMLADLEDKTTIQFVVVTISGLNGRDIAKYAADLGNELGVGQKKTDNGILLLISKSDYEDGNKSVFLAPGKGMEGDLTDSQAGRILDQFFVPNRDNDDWDAATTQTVQAVINHVAPDQHVAGVDSGVVAKEPPTPWNETWWGILLIIVGVIVLLIVLAAAGVLDGGGGGSGGSSFGGGSSGGSSFGGGSFGGGGAGR
ncbi:TPM domain-containing protein [Candidatus Saccharibacteria bacterium]|nr:TPM domain-containing protein [Candidatus Saccharibacteria bacterium]